MWFSTCAFCEEIRKLVVKRPCYYTGIHIFIISRNSAVFYCKSANLIGSSTVFYSPIENDRARVAL